MPATKATLVYASGPVAAGAVIDTGWLQVDSFDNVTAYAEQTAGAILRLLDCQVRGPGFVLGGPPVIAAAFPAAIGSTRQSIGINPVDPANPQVVPYEVRYTIAAVVDPTATCSLCVVGR